MVLGADRKVEDRGRVYRTKLILRLCFGLLLMSVLAPLTLTLLGGTLGLMENVKLSLLGKVADTPLELAVPTLCAAALIWMIWRRILDDFWSLTLLRVDAKLRRAREQGPDRPEAEPRAPAASAEDKLSA